MLILIFIANIIKTYCSNISIFAIIYSSLICKFLKFIKLEVRCCTLYDYMLDYYWYIAINYKK